MSPPKKKSFSELAKLSKPFSSKSLLPYSLLFTKTGPRILQDTIFITCTAFLNIHRAQFRSTSFPSKYTTKMMSSTYTKYSKDEPNSFYFFFFFKREIFLKTDSVHS